MNSWTLSEENAQKIREKTQDRVMQMAKLKVYYEYVEGQAEGFKSIMGFVVARIQDLIDSGRISDFVEIRARIKAAESSLENDKTKALDDIFGMEIITATEEEYDTIIKNLAPYMSKTKCKKHNKDNGYVAKHKYWTFKKDKMGHLEESFDYDSDIPMIEFQFKTSQVQISCNTGPANHEDYKGEKREDIQRKFDEGRFNKYNTPIMWVSERKDQKLGMRLLSEEETLKKIYPFLNTKPTRKGINR